VALGSVMGGVRIGTLGNIGIGKEG